MQAVTYILGEFRVVSVKRALPGGYHRCSYEGLEFTALSSELYDGPILSVLADGLNAIARHDRAGYDRARKLLYPPENTRAAWSLTVPPDDTIAANGHGQATG